MHIKVKNIANRVEEFDVEPNTTVSSFANTVTERYSHKHTTKLIYGGKIMENTKCLSEYFGFADQVTGFVICIPEMKQQVQQSATAETSQVVQNVTPQVQSANPGEQTYTIKQVRALLLVFMRYVRVTPLLQYVFNRVDSGLQDIILDADLISENGFLTQLMKQTEKIANSIDNNTDIPVQMPPLDLGKIFANVMRSEEFQAANFAQMLTAFATNSFGNQAENVSFHAGYGAPEGHADHAGHAAPEGPGGPGGPGGHAGHAAHTGNNDIYISSENCTDSDENESDGEVQGGNVVNADDLTENDKKNIDTLVNMGFSQRDAIFAYLAAGKSLDLAASSLLD